MNFRWASSFFDSERIPLFEFFALLSLFRILFSPLTPNSTRSFGRVRSSFLRLPVCSRATCSNICLLFSSPSLSCLATTSAGRKFSHNVAVAVVITSSSSLLAFVYFWAEPDFLHPLRCITSIFEVFFTGVEFFVVASNKTFDVLNATLDTFLKRWAIPGLFFFNFVFSIIQLVDKLVDKILSMTGYEPRISDVGSDHSTNWATTTAQLH